MDKWEELDDTLHTVIESDKRSITNPKSTDRYDDGFFDGIYMVIKKMQELDHRERYNATKAFLNRGNDNCG